MLVIGTYTQGPGGRKEASGITSPSLNSIPMNDFDTCKNAVKNFQQNTEGLFGNLVANGFAYLAEMVNKVTF